jgi:hypothetical protein
MRSRPLRIRRKRPVRRFGRAANVVAALCASVVLLGVLGFGYGPIPALGPALDPGRGAWTSAAGEVLTALTGTALFSPERSGLKLLVTWHSTVANRHG